jgi:tRNA modification GTPase
MIEMNIPITALATPPGIGGIAVIRVSGKNVIEICDTIFIGKSKLIDAKTHTIHYGKIYRNDTLIDTVTCSIFKSPNSYTGEDIVEISCHGGMIISQEIISLLIDKGIRLAEPGEFTKRAFLNGKMDLLQVEAVADLIHSISVKAEQTSARQLMGGLSEKFSILRKQLIDVCSLLELELDFSEEDLEFVDKTDIKNKIFDVIDYCQSLNQLQKSSEILRSGFFVGIAGYPNSGKSTFFNALLNKDRAIVSSIPGTTRDYLEEIIYINDLPIRIIDTAGIRETTDIIEIEGIKFVEKLLNQSNLILVINDITISETNSDILYNNLIEKYPDREIIVIQNKIDLTSINLNKDKSYKEFYISAKGSIGIEDIKNYIYSLALNSTDRVKDIILNQRHSIILKNAVEILNNAINAIDYNMENEVISIEIRTAIKVLGEITGETYSEDILNNIFSNFCIGK